MRRIEDRPEIAVAHGVHHAQDGVRIAQQLAHARLHAKAQAGLLRFPGHERETLHHGVPLALPLKRGVDLHRELLSVADAFLVRGVAAELERRGEAVALDGCGLKVIGDLDGVLEQHPRLGPLLAVQAHRTRQHRAEIDHAQALAVAQLLELVPLRVDLHQVLAADAFELDRIKAERLHFF